MIKHIVLFKLKDKSTENIEKATNMLMDMKCKIIEIKHIEVGVDIIYSDRSYDISLLIKFDSVKDLESYRINPIHVEVAEYMVSVCESIVMVDYEFS